MKQIITLGIFILLSFSLFGQNKETRNHTDFTQLSVSGVIQVTITQSDSYSVEIIGSEDVIGKVKTSQTGERLDISVASSSSASGRVIVAVSMPHLEKVKATGVSLIKINGVLKTENIQFIVSGASVITAAVNTPSLSVDVSGASIVSVVGYAENLKASASGASSFAGKELTTVNAQVNISGSSSGFVNVQEEISGEVSGASNLSIKGGDNTVNNVKTKGVALINSEIRSDININTDVIEDIEIKNDIVGDIIYKETMDSTIISVGNKKVIIVDDYDKTRVEVKTKEEKESHKYLGGSFDVGMNGYLTPNQSTSLPASQSQMQLRYPRSREFSMNLMIQGLDFAKERFYFTTGLGLNYAGYHFKNRSINIVTTPDTTAFIDAPFSYNKYKLRATYLQVPVMFGVRFGNVKKDYGMQLGMIGGLRVGSIIKEKYDFDGRGVKNKIKDDFNFNPFKASATVRLRFNWFSIYANYALTPLFEKNRAPELYPFSVGLTFGSI
jgi:hypothetical protein